MSKDEYLARLGALLAGQMPPTEIDGILHYYEQYFHEVGPDGEEALLWELGAPEELASRILGRPVEGPGYRQAPPSPQEWDLSNPRYAPLSAGVRVCLALTAVLLFVIAFALLAGLAGSGVVCAAVGGGVLLRGLLPALGWFSGSMAARLLMGGAGLLTAGIGLLLLAGGIAAFRGIWRAAVRLLRRAVGGEAQ